MAGTPCGGVFCCSMFTGQPERILPHKTFSSNGGKKSVQDPPVLTVSGLDARFSATMGKADGYFVDTQTNFGFFSADDILYIRILGKLHRGGFVVQRSEQVLFYVSDRAAVLCKALQHKANMVGV